VSTIGLQTGLTIAFTAAWTLAKSPTFTRFRTGQVLVEPRQMAHYTV